MEKVLSKIVALGVPGIVLVIAMSSTGWVGAAAITTALASLGPFGIIGGIVTLGVIGLVASAFSEFGTEIIIKSVVKENLKTKSSMTIKSEIDKMWISKSLKLKVKDYIDNYQ